MLPGYKLMRIATKCPKTRSGDALPLNQPIWNRIYSQIWRIWQCLNILALNQQQVFHGILCPFREIPQWPFLRVSPSKHTPYYLPVTTRKVELELRYSRGVFSQPWR